LNPDGTAAECACAMSVGRTGVSQLVGVITGSSGGMIVSLSSQLVDRSRAVQLLDEALPSLRSVSWGRARGTTCVQQVPKAGAWIVGEHQVAEL
jgi:hypothetical protein